MRLIFPMWFLGGFQFSWLVLYKINPYLGWFSLLSPFTYANEASRSSILGPENFLSFWLCIAILGIGSIVLGYQGYVMVKRKVDLI
jgi:ABC-type multidrug transport system permease subunit